jgi:hypothetical protein
MTVRSEKELRSIRIGPAYMWRLDERGASTREDRLAFMFRVTGMPAEVEARIGTGKRPGRWTFFVRCQSQSETEPRSEYKSKEEALEGFRSWLVNNWQHVNGV